MVNANHKILTATAIVPINTQQLPSTMLSFASVSKLVSLRNYSYENVFPNGLIFKQIKLILKWFYTRTRFDRVARANSEMNGQ